MLGCKIWIENFDALLAVVKEYLRPIADYLRKGTLPEDDRLAREIHVHVVLYQNQNTLMDSVFYYLAVNNNLQIILPTICRSCCLMKHTMIHLEGYQDLRGAFTTLLVALQTFFSEQMSSHSDT